jgi:ketosteroid isomerase-like protein
MIIMAPIIRVSMIRTRSSAVIRNAATIFICIVVIGPYSWARPLWEQRVNQKTDNLIEKEVLQIANDIFTAIKGKDTKKLDQILADDFVYRNPIEGERSRAEFLAIIDSLPVKIVSVWSEDMKVNVYGDVAVTTGTQKAKIQNEESKEEISATAFVDVFVKRQGKWKLVLAHSMDLPAEK